MHLPEQRRKQPLHQLVVADVAGLDALLKAVLCDRVWCATHTRIQHLPWSLELWRQAQLLSSRPCSAPGSLGGCPAP